MVGAGREVSGKVEQSGIESLVSLSCRGGELFFPFDTLGLPSLIVFILMLPGLPSFPPIIKNKNSLNSCIQWQD